MIVDETGAREPKVTLVCWERKAAKDELTCAGSQKLLEESRLSITGYTHPQLMCTYPKPQVPWFYRRCLEFIFDKFRVRSTKSV